MYESAGCRNLFMGDEKFFHILLNIES